MSTWSSGNPKNKLIDWLVLADICVDKRKKRELVGLTPYKVSVSTQSGNSLQNFGFN